MIVNGSELLISEPIKDMLSTKERKHGVSHGLAEAGYDIRVKQDILFMVKNRSYPVVKVDQVKTVNTRFTLASAIEEFQMPFDLVGVVHDKSTWARKGLSVLNTVIEPGWKGFLTVELVYHGSENLKIPAGSGIAQVLFSKVQLPAAYDGKYQFQEDRPVDARFVS